MFVGVKRRRGCVHRLDRGRNGPGDARLQRTGTRLGFRAPVHRAARIRQGTQDPLRGASRGGRGADIGGRCICRPAAHVHPVPPVGMARTAPDSAEKRPARRPTEKIKSPRLQEILCWASRCKSSWHPSGRTSMGPPRRFIETRAGRRRIAPEHGGTRRLAGPFFPLSGPDDCLPATGVRRASPVARG
ncbi:MAG: hypothetical protein HLUCCO15_02680 [Erythrobacteraceae bacterium HL-111]|nr:MAG: hypothetical protein HLUCCO15_02680 [Erythrobacteraceae bacterium HL-111]